MLFIFTGVNKAQAVCEHWKKAILVVRAEGICSQYLISVMRK